MDAALVMAQVVRAQLSAGHLEAPASCVQRRLTEVTFDDDRKRTGRGNASSASPPPLYFAWKAPAKAPGEWPKDALDPKAAKLLSKAADEITRAPRQPPLIGVIVKDWLPPRLQFCPENGPPRPNFFFSAPAVQRDLGFVAAGYGCGGLCGNGVLYALRRTRSGWKVVGVADTWVS